MIQQNTKLWWHTIVKTTAIECQHVLWCHRESNRTFNKLVSLPIASPMWDSFVNDLTYFEIKNLNTNGILPLKINYENSVMLDEWKPYNNKNHICYIPLKRMTFVIQWKLIATFKCHRKVVFHILYAIIDFVIKY